MEEAVGGNKESCKERSNVQEVHNLLVDTYMYQIALDSRQNEITALTEVQEICHAWAKKRVMTLD